MRPDAQETDVSALLGVRLADEKAAGRAYAAYPNLANVRWLLPANRPAWRRAGIGGLYQPNSLRGRAVRTIIAAGLCRAKRYGWKKTPWHTWRRCWPPSSAWGPYAWLSTWAYPPAPKSHGADAGPGRKDVGLRKDRHFFLGRAAVESEKRALLRLSESADLQGAVPRVLGSLEWHGGTIFVVTMGPPRPGPRRLSSVHLRFCTRLFQSFRVQETFVESPMWARMHEIWLRLQHSSPETLPSNLGQALERLHDELGPVSMPLSLAHGDFVPWNTQLGPQSLFVLDWERASEGMSPLYDVFDFQSLQAALQGRRGT